MNQPIAPAEERLLTKRRLDFDLQHLAVCVLGCQVAVYRHYTDQSKTKFAGFMPCVECGCGQICCSVDLRR